MERFKTPTPNMDGKVTPALSNFIMINNVPNIAMPQCQYEIALEMTNPTPDKKRKCRIDGTSAHGESPWRFKHHMLPQDTLEAFSNGQVSYIYKDYMFRGRVDEWRDPFLFERKYGGKYKPTMTRIQAFTYAYCICKLLNRDKIYIELVQRSGETEQIPFDESCFAEVEGYLNKCVQWASGKRPVTYIDHPKYHWMCHIRATNDYRLVYSCPYNTIEDLEDYQSNWPSFAPTN